ncbi:MAG: secretin N-terminal domain-containing protein [Planctomycetota bacterium]|jgi:type II secretion system protein D
MTAPKRVKRLIIVAVPVGLLVAVLAVLLSSGSGQPIERGGRGFGDRRSRVPPRPTAHVARITQATSPASNPVQVPSPSAAGNSASEPQLRIYRWPGGDAHRVVFDQRTAQILVVAPPEIQAQVAGLVTNGAGAAVGAEPGVPAAADRAKTAVSPTAPEPTGSRDVQLRHTTSEQFEAALLRLLGSRLTPVAGYQPGVPAYRLEFPNRSVVGVAIDPRLGRVRIDGSGLALDSSVEIIRALDRPLQSGGEAMRLVTVKESRLPDVQRMIDAIRASHLTSAGQYYGGPTTGWQGDPRVAMAYQQPEAAAPKAAQPVAPAQQPGPLVAPGQQPAVPGVPGQLPGVPGGIPGQPPVAGEEGEGAGGVLGQVRVQVVPPDTILLWGTPRDLQTMAELIEQLDDIIAGTVPDVRVLHLRHVDCEALAELLNQIYQDIFAMRTGTVSITALVKPNALLLIGREEAVATVVGLTQQLDRPVPPHTQFHVFRLRRANVTAVQEIVENFFEDRGILGTQARAIADIRSNSLIVQASPRDVAEVAALIQQLETPSSDSVNQVRVIQLYHSLADEVATTLEEAITAAAAGDEQRATMLELVTIDTEGPQRVRSGILTDVTITPNTRGNSLMISAPAENMPLLEKLVEQLDSPPTAEAHVKVFTILNGEAANLVTVLETLFAEQTQAGEPAVQTAGAEGESSLVPLVFATDERTNSIIAIGSLGDLTVVEAVLLRLDETDLRDRQIELYHLQHADGQAVSELVLQIYSEQYELRQGLVSITPLVKPNALLLVGRPGSLETVLDLIKRLDRPVAASSQFHVFHLQYTSSLTAEQVIDIFYNQQAAGGLSPRIRMTSDFRTNSLIVQASPSDMAEVTRLIEEIDSPDSQAFNEIRIFHLQNTLAEELAPILQDAFTGQIYGPQAQQVGAFGAAQRQNFEEKSIRLQFLTVDSERKELLKSGILADVTITAEPRQNAVIVTASADSIPLIKAIIDELDQLPVAVAQIKVFTILNGDAATMATMLEGLFAQQAQAGQPAVRTGAAEGDSTLVPLQFGVDERTNSIIVTGSLGDLTVVDAILLRLDESTLETRRTVVYRLKHAFATNVADVLAQFLEDKIAVQETIPGQSPYEQMEREVIIVAEEISNQLIVSATDRYFQEVTEMVERLDSRPPMVMIQVLIAEVFLTQTDEFGVEIGMQDTLLFNRGLGPIGFLFNDTGQSLGNDTSVPGRNNVGTQGLGDLGLGRQNSQLGYGGLVVSASSSYLSVLLRALHQQGRVDILSRPSVMALDNQEAAITVGERVALITGTQSFSGGLGGQQNNFSWEPIGLEIYVTPRISPDGMVMMNIFASKTSLGPEEEGTAISVTTTGDIIRQPNVRTIEAQTVISAMDGQTVILGGLIQKNVEVGHRKVPFFGDLPIVGRAFRFDDEEEVKVELLIIMTPHIVESQEDLETIKRVEAARMDWCLCDVIEMHGESGLAGSSDGAGPMVIYPDLDPGADGISVPPNARRQSPGPAPAPAPEDSPFRLEPPPSGPGSGAAAPPTGSTSRVGSWQSRTASADGVTHPGYDWQAGDPSRMPANAIPAAYDRVQSRPRYEAPAGPGAQSPYPTSTRPAPRHAGQTPMELGTVVR